MKISALVATAGLLFLGCGPRHTPPVEIRLDNVTTTTDGALHVDFGLDGASRTRSAAPGILAISIRERPTLAVTIGTGDVVCSGHVAVPAEAFDKFNWRVSVDVPLDMPCPPPPTDDQRVREMGVTFTTEGGKALPEHRTDPPLPFRGPNTMKESEKILSMRAIYTPRTTGPEVERVRAYAASVAALQPLVLAAPFGRCSPVPSDVSAPLINYEDVVRMARRLEERPEPIASMYEKRRTLSAVVGIVTLLAEHGRDEAVTEASRWTQSAPDLVWIVRSTARTEGLLMGQGIFEPGSWTGTLHLARRSTAQVLCGTAVVATSGSKVSAKVADVAQARALRDTSELTRALQADLDIHVQGAVDVARDRLVGNAVIFEREPRRPR